MIKNRCERAGGKVVAGLCVIVGADRIQITDFKEKTIDIPTNVQRLFFRYPSEIKVEEIIGDNEGVKISTFEEVSATFYWNEEEKKLNL